MADSEARYRVTSALLQADGPLSLDEVLEASGLGKRQLRSMLRTLVGEELVVEGELVADKPAPQFCWAARWQRKVGREALSARRRLQAIIKQPKTPPTRPPDINSKPVLAFNDFVVKQYEPPAEKRFLVFLQCSVRRPFSSSPSHGSMRRAIYVATGYWPRKDFEACPVHVVVLASNVGPVPYELEDVFPANVRSGGVKHFSPEHYEEVKPILAERMAAYITAHRRRCRHMATFTDGRYADVMREARRIACLDFPVLPDGDSPIVVRMGKSRPRTYWQKYWIQLYLEILTWLTPRQRRQAKARLKELDVEYR